MGTDSVVIKRIYAFLLRLNFFFEHSLIFRGVCAVKNAAKTSRIVGSFLATPRDYWGGSVITRAIGFFAGVLFSCAAWIVRIFRVTNENSANKRLFDFIVKERPAGFFAKTIMGCVPVRLGRWFFCEENAAMPQTFSIARVFDAKVWYMIFLAGMLIVPYPMWNNMYLLLSAMLFAGVFALRRILQRGNAPLDFSNISPALVMFVFFCGLSVFTGYGGGDSFRVFVIFLACVIHCVIVANVFGRKDLRLFALIVAVALGLAALFGFYQFFAGIEISEQMTDLGASPGLSRLYSTMGNPNTDAQAWAMLLPFVIAAAVCVRDDVRRLVLLGALVIIVAAFALTFSRAGYVALLAGVGVFVIMTAPRLVPIGLIALVFAIPFIPSAILERLFTLGQDTSSQYRFLIWGGVIRMIEDFWVQGIGMGPAAFVRIYRTYAHPLAERALHSHNTFLDILAHSGIGAFLAFLAYIFRLFRNGIAAHAREISQTQKIFISACIAALTVFVVFGVGEYVWFYPRVMLVFWLTAGIATVGGRHEVHKHTRR